MSLGTLEAISETISNTLGEIAAASEKVSGIMEIPADEPVSIKMKHWGLAGATAKVRLIALAGHR